jgi:hypothetical protein
MHCSHVLSTLTVHKLWLNLSYKSSSTLTYHNRQILHFALRCNPQFTQSPQDWKLDCMDNFLDCYSNLPGRLEEDQIMWKPVKAGKFEVFFDF